MTIVEKAMRLAARAHAGQMRKEVDLPYLIHPCMVALMLQKHGFSDAVVAAALVHDVLEDTDVSEDEMRQELGDEVTAMVKTLSYDHSLSWEGQRARYIAAVRAAPVEVKAISVADKIHNAQSLVAMYEQEGPALWNRFNRPRDIKLKFEVEMLAMLQETWQHPLVEEYSILVEEMKTLA